MSHGFQLPDPSCTPGAINPTVTLTILKRPGFHTPCLRDKATSAAEKNATYECYKLRHPWHNVGNRQTCEKDHLISLELGGADTLDNIWPECGPSGVSLRKRFFKQKASSRATSPGKSGRSGLALPTRRRALLKIGRNTSTMRFMPNDARQLAT